MAECKKTEMLNKIDVFSRNTILENMLEIENASFLDDSIVSGKVLRIPFKGALPITEYEIGALILEPGAEVKAHDHQEYIETYSVISGDNMILSPQIPKYEKFNFCGVRQQHFIKNGNSYGVVIYTKINKA